MIWTTIAVIGAIYLGLMLMLFLFQAHFIYFPSSIIAATPATVGLEYESVRLETADGVSIFGWYVPAANAEQTVLFFHGNGGNISHRLDSIALFHRLGLNLFIIDYRGYGQSEGQTDEHGTYLDAEAAWLYLVEQRQVKPENIVIFGRSLGGAVATWLAQRHTPGALILESTFTSVPDMGARQFPFLPVHLLARIRDNSIDRLPLVACPVLVVHSPEDEIIPYSHGQQLFQVAPEPKQFLELKGGHNEGFIISEPAYARGLQTFLETHLR